MRLDDILKTLRDDPLSLKWRKHGIGFIKAYVNEEKTLRLHIYDKRFLVPGMTLHHDHPWNLISDILCGELVNTRFVRDADAPDKFMEGTINCRAFKGVQGRPRKVGLRRSSVEVYTAGNRYSQRANEIHTTVAEDGTMTLMERVVDPASDGTASVFWPVGTKYANAEIAELKNSDILAAIEGLSQPR